MTLKQSESTQKLENVCTIELYWPKKSFTYDFRILGIKLRYFLRGDVSGEVPGVNHVHGWIGLTKLVGIGHTFGPDWEDSK